MANPAPTINQINAFNATQGTTIDFNIIGGTELIRSNRIYIYDLSDNSLICTHLYVSTESIHELPPNTDGSIVYESGKSSADFVNGAQYYAQIQTYTDTNGTQGGSGLSVAKMFWCLSDPTLTITTIPSTISTTSYNISATYTDTSASVVSNIIQQYQFNLYSATGSLLQSSGVVVGNGTQQGTSAVYDISHNFTGLNVGSSYYVTVDVTTTQGMSVTTQSNTFTVSIDTPTLGEATVVNNACDGYISVTSNLSGEYGGSGSGEIVSFETDSENVFSKLQVELEPIQEGSGTPSPSNVRPIRGHSEVDVNVVGKNLFKAIREGITSNGITYTLTDNGNYKAEGTATGNSVFYIIEPTESFEISKGTYTFSLNTSYFVGAFYCSSLGWKDINSTKKTFTIENDDIITNIWIRAFSGTNVPKGTTVDFQIEKGSTATEYEPYNPNSTTVSQDFNATLTPTSTDTTPYLFKAVGDVYGDRLEDKIVGGTVAWNQLIESTNSAKWGAQNAVGNYVDGIYTFIANAKNGLAYIEWSKASTINHIYLGSVDIKLSTATTSVVTDWYGASPITPTQSTTSWQTVSSISKMQTSVLMRLCVRDARDSDWDAIQVKNAQVFDLTQMFGSTIADYIYSLEQSQAGAGVAWFKKLFPNDYYAYNAGELLSVEGLQSHDTVGFNQWDEEWEVGGIDSNGVPYSDTSVIRTKNYIPILPQTAYCWGKSLYAKHSSEAVGILVRYYDKDKNFISAETSIYTNWSESNFIKTSPQNAYYAKFMMSSTYGTTYNHDICINLSNPTRNGEYEPYEKHSYPLDSSLTLRGIPKLDASNNLYYDGDEYTSDGKVKRKYGVVVLDGTSGKAFRGVWGSQSNNPNGYAVYITGIRSKTSNVISNRFIYNGNGVDTMPLYSFVGGSGAADTWTFILPNTVTSLSEANAWLANNPTTIVYELATPTTETAEPYTNPQIVSKYGTLEYVTNSIVPVGHKTTYLTRDIFGGYVDLISGKLVVTHGYVDLGALDWAYVSSNSIYAPYFRAPFGGVKYAGLPYNVAANILTNSYTTSLRAQGSFNDKCVCMDGDSTKYVEVQIKDSSYTNATTFKSAMNGVQLVYELATPQAYQLTPQQVNTLVGTNNVWSEQGNIELSYHIPITNLLVKRQDVDDVSGGWLTLYSQPISQASDMDFTFIDFLNQYGKTYKYALVPLLTQTQSGVEVEVEGGYTVSDEVQSVFDGVFIADSTGSQKCKANVGYGNVDMNQVVGSITPIGAKYPIIVTNSHNQYHNGSISGTIVPDDYYFNGNLSRIDMVKKRNELEQFLTNKRVKVIKDWNGNIWLVMIVGNVSCTFNNNYGMGIVNFSTNWTEVGDPTNQQDLQATGLINIGGV